MKERIHTAKSSSNSNNKFINSLKRPEKPLSHCGIRAFVTKSILRMKKCLFDDSGGVECLGHDHFIAICVVDYDLDTFNLGLFFKLLAEIGEGSFC